MDGATSKEPPEMTGHPVDTRCGVGFCKPAWLQTFATIQSFVGFNSVSHLFNFSLRMLVISQVTTLEKRFALNSSQSGFILSSSQITFLLFILFFSYYGRTSHIPRILSVCSIIAGLSGLMFATAHFLPLYDSLDRREPASNALFQGNTTSINSDAVVCRSGGIHNASQGDNCQGETDQSDISRSAMAIFVVAMLIQGAATSPRSPLAGTYIDDNNPIPTKTGMYMGFMMGILTLSPVLAFGMGAVSSGVHHTLEARPDLTPNDSRWIGAWWLGFLVLGMMTILTSSLVFLFPKRLKMPAMKEKDETGANQAYVLNKEIPVKQLGKTTEKSEERAKQLLQKMKGLFFGILRVLRNPVYTLCVLVGTLQAFAMMGMLAFLPKYLETQFYVPTFKTNIMLGVISLLGNTLGPICGGLLTSRFKLSTLGNIRLVMCSCILLTIGCPIAMFIAGNQTNLLKPDLPGNPTHDGPVSNCVADCFCPDSTLLPVCGSDGVTYYSPCHAGCNGRENGTYVGCSCTNGTAAPGFCAKEDSKVYIMLVYTILATFVLTLSMSPAFMIYVRSVSESDKALALGLSSFSSTLLGYLPGPIVYGKLVDTACILWQESCSGRGACALYDLADLRYKIFGTNMGLFFLSFLCILFALLCHSRSLKRVKKICNYEMVTKSDLAVPRNTTLNETSAEYYCSINGDAR